MNPKRFRTLVNDIRKTDSRFSPNAYSFLLEALDFTVAQKREQNEQQIPSPREVFSPPGLHVSCRDLLVGFLEFSLDKFGPMASTVLKEWGIKSSYNVGEIVFQLIDKGILSKQPSDSLKDFKSYVDLHATLSAPYQPLSAKSKQAP